MACMIVQLCTSASSWDWRLCRSARLMQTLDLSKAFCSCAALLCARKWVCRCCALFLGSHAGAGLQCKFQHALHWKDRIPIECHLLSLQDGSGETLQLERGSEEEQRADFVAKQLGYEFLLQVPGHELTFLDFHVSSLGVSPASCCLISSRKPLYCSSIMFFQPQLLLHTSFFNIAATFPAPCCVCWPISDTLSCGICSIPSGFRSSIHPKSQSLYV